MKYLSFSSRWALKEPGGSKPSEKPEEKTEPRKMVWMLQVAKIHMETLSECLGERDGGVIQRPLSASETRVKSN